LPGHWAAEISIDLKFRRIRWASGARCGIGGEKAAKPRTISRSSSSRHPFVGAGLGHKVLRGGARAGEGKPHGLQANFRHRMDAQKGGRGALPSWFPPKAGVVIALLVVNQTSAKCEGRPQDREM